MEPERVLPNSGKRSRRLGRLALLALLPVLILIRFAPWSSASALRRDRTGEDLHSQPAEKEEPRPPKAESDGPEGAAGEGLAGQPACQDIQTSSGVQEVRLAITTERLGQVVVPRIERLDSSEG
jgi:hypothetical protein